MSINVHVTCLCGKSRDTVRASGQSLPIETILCHCNICRYTSGVLCLSYLPLASPPRLESSLKSYRSSAKMKRHFCEVCGSHIFAYNSDLNQWYLTTGAIATPNPQSAGHNMQTTRLVQHEFVSDTLDGGLAPCLATMQGRKLTFFAQGPNEEPLTVSNDEDPTSALAELDFSGGQRPTVVCSKDHLHASCHCGGVQFMLSRPNEHSYGLSSPWPDLLVPYHSQSLQNGGDVKWWLRSEGRKYLAGTCACKSCRLASGFSIQTWAFVPKVNIKTTDGHLLSFAMGTLKQYNSGLGVYREFCGTCGATVFWHCDERPDLIDVSVGLLRAEEGSRAEKWLEWWTERVSFKEDAVDTELIVALEEGLPSISR